MPLALERHPRARCPGLSVGALGLVAGGRGCLKPSDCKTLASSAFGHKVRRSQGRLRRESGIRCAG